MSFDGHKRDWEAMAEIDPLWAILTDSGKRGGGWTPEDFFAQGELEIAEMLAAAAAVGGPATGARALDFGCGAGRLTRALGNRFDESVGVARYLREFVRVTRPGCLIVFQLPSPMPLRYRFQPKRRIYAALRRVGVTDRFLVERTWLTPMRMVAMDVDEVRAEIAGSGGSVLKVDSDDPMSTRYFVRPD